MKVVVDITHPAHFNLFKNLIVKLVSQGNEVFIMVLDRSKIIAIAKNELPENNIVVVGKWYKSHFKKILFSNIIRSIKIMFLLAKWKPNIAISSGSIPLGFACKLNGIPNIQISDDPERILSSKIEIMVATKKYYPPFIEHPPKKTGVYNCLKQWAYLTPAVFRPNELVLNFYSLQKKKYFFIRDVSLKSLNYSNQEQDIIQKIVEELPKEYKVLLSLEDKSKRKDFPDDWVLLKEPVEDIHSLMYYSKIVISTGDSMVREGALLGVPSIYLGQRDMAANTILMKKNILFKANKSDFNIVLENALTLSLNSEFQENTRNSLLSEWDDLNEFMMQKINIYKK